MPLPSPNLDDLRFQQDLVDEARRRIVRYCPEWTDYNLSDPGITLIELFAWMTEQILYRLNRVPEKNYIQFMDMLGIQLQPASSARAALTFWLSAPFPLGPEDETRTIVPQGQEVATWATDEEPEIVFTTDERLLIAPPRLIELRRQDRFNRNDLSRLGREDFYPFDQDRPRVGDTFYLGFDPDHDISGFILRLAFQCRETQATGIKRDDPPLVWECSLGGDQWQELQPSERRGERDTTGGLNNAQGSLVLYLPLSMRLDRVHGRSAYWVRCRLEPRREDQGMYAHSPRILGIDTYVLGGTVRATHAEVVSGEVLGRSDGEPGQRYTLQHAPLLSLSEGETVEVQEERDGEVVYVPWERASDFSMSSRHDRHYTLDEATGEVCFGPSIIKPDGTSYAYGRVPEAVRLIRISRYRHGGGVVGNVPPGKIQVLRSAIPYIDRVTNLEPARGGQDQESIEEAKMRAQREVRAQQRAVTAEDFEALALRSTRAVARVKCRAPGDLSPEAEDGALPPGMVELLVVPASFGDSEGRDRRGLVVDQPLQNTVRAYLDRYRLLTTTIHIREPRYVGIAVRARIVVSEYHRPQTVVRRARELLRHLISPLALETDDEWLAEILGPGWEGWPFGRDLYVSQLYSLLQRVPGVEHVLEVQLGQRPVVPAKEASPAGGAPPGGEVPADDGEGEEPAEEDVPLSEQRVVPVPDDALVCLLDAEVEVVTL